jgi:hypothetical protein
LTLGAKEQLYSIQNLYGNALLLMLLPLLLLLLLVLFPLLLIFVADRCSMVHLLVLFTEWRYFD